MSKNRGGQGGQQQPQIPSIDVEATVSSSRLINVSIQAKLGNRPNGNQLATVFLRKAGSQWVQDKSATTDLVTGRVSIPVSVDSPGLYDVEVQIGTVRNFTTVEVAAEKKNPPFLFVKPNRIKNKLWFMISGTKGAKFQIQTSKDSKESKEVQLDGFYRYPKKGFIELATGEEYEFLVVLLEEDTVPYHETFRGYEDSPLYNRVDNWPSLVWGFVSTNLGRFLAILLLSFFVGIVLLPYFPELAYSWFANNEPLVWLVNIVMFFGFIFSAISWMPKVDSRLNNWIWFGWIFFSFLMLWLACSLPSGEGLFDQAVKEHRNSDALNSMYSMSADFTGEAKKVPGIWLWWNLFFVYSIQTILLIPFAYWDEFQEAKNRFQEIYQQRGKKIQTVVKQSNPSSSSSTSQDNIFNKFWNGIKGEMDSALLAAGVTEAAMYFVRQVSRKTPR